MVKIYLRLFCFFKSNYFLYAINLLIKGRKKYLTYLPNRTTDCCLEGYPSSANSYSFNLLRNTYPNIRIAHHTHSLAAVKYSLKHRIKTIIIFRHPLDCVASILSRRYFSESKRTLFVDLFLYQYIDFYRYILQTNEPLMLCSFNEVVKEPSSFLNRCSNYLEIPAVHPNFSEFDKRIKNEMEIWYKKFDKMNDGIPLPGNKRSVVRTNIKTSIKLSYFYEEALEIFNALNCKQMEQIIND